MLNWLAVINPLLSTVNPSETQSHLYGIHIAHNARELLSCPVDTEPEVRYLIVIFKVPSVEFFSGVDIKEIGDFQ